MNNGNALGFVVFGAVMWLLPIAAPGWFPHGAVDGTSARAIWIELMGTVELVLGLSFLVHRWCVPAVQRWISLGEARGALATGDWQSAGFSPNLLAVDATAFEPAFVPAAGLAEVGSVTLRGEQAALWLAISRALPDDGNVTEFIAHARAAERTRSARPHPIAAAAFRHYPQHSFVHLVHPDVVDLGGLPGRLRDATLGRKQAA
ncbi:MAG TPA: hypothetical protein VHE61_20735 [Opitutaceae bacterium]|nr:hypothetical protein [Opitutaceae bacterium]